MTGAERLAQRFPVAWHVIEADGLAAARRLGLLPSATLRSLAGRPASDANRDGFERLELEAGVAVLRFQQMPDARLLPTLHGIYAGEPGRWRAMIDAHVFFWVASDRLARFLAAITRERRRTEPEAPEPVVLRFDTAALLAEHGNRALYTTINSGSTAGRGRARRDEHTFRPVGLYQRGPVAEIAVPGRVAIPRDTDPPEKERQDGSRRRAARHGRGDADPLRSTS